MSTSWSRGKLMRCCVAALGAAVGCAAALPPAGAPSYTATPLGTLGGTSARSHAINNRGQVTGQSYTAGNAAAHAFVYSAGAMFDLGTLGGASSWGHGINDAGQVAGSSSVAGDLASRAFLYSGGMMTDLGTLGGPNSRGLGINASGQVTGDADLPGGRTRHAFVYLNGRMTDLGTLEDAPFFGTASLGAAINASGEVAGWSAVLGPAPRYRAFLYSGGRMVGLGTLGGANSWGFGINDRGQVTGTSETPESGTYGGHIFSYAGGSMTDLGTLGGGYAESNAINVRGQVTGWSYTADNAVLAFLYSDGRMYDLNALVVSGLGGAILREATGINDSGQIVANTCAPSSGLPLCAAYRLDPVTATVAEIPMLSRTALAAVALVVLAAGMLLLKQG